jgi:hypothetical protein
MRKTREFISNAEYGKDRDQLTDEIREVNAETRKRTNNRVDLEDQQWRHRNLREARDRLN